MNAAVAKPALLKRFGVAMLSSWVTGPLGAAYLYWIGWGGEPYVIIALLSISAVAPMQLMMNEFIAAGRAAGSFRVSTGNQIALFLACVAASLLALRGFGDPAGMSDLTAAILFVSAGAAISVQLSSAIATRFYSAVIHGRASHRSSMMIGSAPGLVMLLCFVVAGSTGNAGWALSATIVPAIVQQMLTVALLPGKAPRAGETSKLLNPATLLATTMLLGAAGWAAGFLRSDLAERAGDLGAIALVLVNILSTTLIMVSRASYLADGHDGVGWALAGALLLGLGSALLRRPVPAVALLLAIFSIQLIVAAVISEARRFAGRNTHNGDRQVNLHG